MGLENLALDLSKEIGHQLFAKQGKVLLHKA